MSNLTIYLLKSSLSLAILYVPYWLFFQKNTFFKINRFYLLASIAFSIIIPLIHFNIYGQTTIPSFEKMMEPVVINAQTTYLTKSNIGYHTIPITNILYFTGAFVFFLFFLHRIMQLSHLIWKNHVESRDGIKFVKVDMEFAPASFFKYVFVSAKSANFTDILIHEKAHVLQGHSWDVLFLEMVKVFFWFNPFVRIYTKALRNVHEFLADEATIKKKNDCAGYQNLVFEHSFGIRLNSLALSFNDSPIKKRFIMMTKNKTNRIKKWGYLTIIPVFVMTLFYFGSELAMAQDSKPTAKKVVEKSDDKEKNKSNEKKEKETYVLVEEMPKFGGKNHKSAFRNYIKDNLVYPEEAKKKGIQGRVYVQFTVNSEGKIVNATVARGVDKLLDNEALRVINSSPQWIPGKQNGKAVDVKFTYPVVFVLQ